MSRSIIHKIKCLECGQTFEHITRHVVCVKQFCENCDYQHKKDYEERKRRINGVARRRILMA